MNFSGVVNQQYSQEQAMVPVSVTSPDLSAAAGSSSLTRSVPMVRRSLYTQGNFEQEDEVFWILSTTGYPWSSLAYHFSKIVYIKADGGFVNEHGQYERIQRTIYMCSNHLDDTNCLLDKTSVIFTNYVVNVLNTHIKGPMIMMGENPFDYQISSLYQALTSRQIKYPPDVSFSERQEIRKRVANVFAEFYRKELFTFSEWICRTTEIRTTQKAVYFLIKKSVGSLSDFLAFEVWRQFSLHEH